MTGNDYSINLSDELEQLNELLQQKGLSYETAERALETYEMERRLSDKHERPLLLDYGFVNIAEDIYNIDPIGEQWREYEELLFNAKERAISRSRYHILAQAYKHRQQAETKSKWLND